MPVPCNESEIKIFISLFVLTYFVAVGDDVMVINNWVMGLSRISLKKQNSL